MTTTTSLCHMFSSRQTRVTCVGVDVSYTWIKSPHREWISNERFGWAHRRDRNQEGMCIIISPSFKVPNIVKANDHLKLFQYSLKKVLLISLLSHSQQPISSLNSTKWLTNLHFSHSFPFIQVLACILLHNTFLRVASTSIAAYKHSCVLNVECRPRRSNYSWMKLKLTWVAVHLSRL